MRVEQFDTSDGLKSVFLHAPASMSTNTTITFPEASGEVALNYNPGKIYYVNNITGSATNNGLTWASAVDQVSTAITLSEAARLASWGGATLTNHNLRNTIFVQGTGTAYTSLTELPSFCDIVGVGACPFGDGSGIVVIGTNTADLDAIAVQCSTSTFRKWICS
jgi:hypothetical protein